MGGQRRAFSEFWVSADFGRVFADTIKLCDGRIRPVCRYARPRSDLGFALSPLQLYSCFVCGRKSY